MAQSDGSEKSPAVLRGDLVAGDGRAPLDPVALVRHAVDTWLAERKAASTATAYRSEWARFLSWWISEGGSAGDVWQVSTQDAADYRDHLARDRGAAAVRRAVAALSSLWASAGREYRRRGLTTRDLPNPWQDVRRPVAEDRRQQGLLSLEETSRLMDAASRNPTTYALVVTLSQTGLRISELVGDSKVRPRTWGDLGRTPHGGWSLSVIGKGGKPRAVAFPSDARDALLSLAHDPTRDSPLVPRPTTGRPLNRHEAWRLIDRAARQAGIETRVHPHTLRHWFISYALAGGAPITTVQHAAGHANLATTSIYAHPVDGQRASDYLPHVDP